MYPYSPFAHPVSSFNKPVPILDEEPGTGNLVPVCLNAHWIPLVIGCLQQLLLQTTWDTSDPAVLAIQQGRVFDLMELFAMSPGCCGLRIRDGVTEFTDDGGVTWTPVPSTNDGSSGHDPRTDEPLKPARTGSDIPCLASANATACFVELHREVVAWWENAALVLIFCGAISAMLQIFFGIGWMTFALTVNYMTFVNDILNYTGALTVASFTVLIQTDLTCIFNDHADANGRWDAAAFAAVLSDIDSRVGDMWRLIEIYVASIGGYAGLNNAGTTTTVATFDCAPCDAEHCHIWDFTTGTQGWTLTDGTTRDGGGLIDGNAPDGAYAKYDIDYNIYVLDFTFYFNANWTGNNPRLTVRTRTGLTTYAVVNGNQNTPVVITINAPVTSLAIVADRQVGSVQHFGTLRLQAVRVRFTGADPFGGDNC